MFLFSYSLGPVLCCVQISVVNYLSAHSRSLIRTFFFIHWLDKCLLLGFSSAYMLVPFLFGHCFCCSLFDNLSQGEYWLCHISHRVWHCKLPRTDSEHTLHFLMRSWTLRPNNRAFTMTEHSCCIPLHSPYFFIQAVCLLASFRLPTWTPGNCWGGSAGPVSNFWRPWTKQPTNQPTNQQDLYTPQHPIFTSCKRDSPQTESTGLRGDFSIFVFVEFRDPLLVSWPKVEV